MSVEDERAFAILGIEACIELAKTCRSKRQIIKELEKFLEENKGKL